MLNFSLDKEQSFDARERVENILAKLPDGDFSVACWEPGQTGPYHCHPHAVEVYFCYQGGGTMRTPAETVDVVPGSFVVHPAGEVHEYLNGPRRTILFRVRYGSDMVSRALSWDGMPGWQPSAADRDYFRKYPVG